MQITYPIHQKHNIYPSFCSTTRVGLLSNSVDYIYSTQSSVFRTDLDWLEICPIFRLFILKTLRKLMLFVKLVQMALNHILWL